MNKKEAIEFLKDHKVEVSSMCGRNKSSDEVITFIRKLDKKCKRGMKFEKMWKVLRKIWVGDPWGGEVGSDMKTLEQKNFPRGEFYEV